MARRINRPNLQFTTSLDLNNETLRDYFYRFKKIALSIFEWVNLPSSMSAEYLEECLFFYGQSAFLKDKKYGFINTKASDNGNINIYGLPTSLHCYSYDYQTNRVVYTRKNK